MVVIEQDVLGYVNTHKKIIEHIQKHPSTIKAAMTRISNIYDANEFVYCTCSSGKDSGATTYLTCSIIQLRRDVLNGDMSIEEYNKLLGTKSKKEYMEANLPTFLFAMDYEINFSGTSEWHERTFKQLCGRYEIGDISWVDKKKENNPGCYSYEQIEKMSTKEIQNLVSGYGRKPLMLGIWACIPIQWESSLNLGETRYISYEPGKEDVWTQPMPKGEYVWNIDNFFEFPVRYEMPPIMDETVVPYMTDQELRVSISAWFKKYGAPELKKLGRSL